MHDNQLKARPDKYEYTHSPIQPYGKDRTRCTIGEGVNPSDSSDSAQANFIDLVEEWRHVLIRGAYDVINGDHKVVKQHSGMA